jgi:hypothetical protein
MNKSATSPACEPHRTRLAEGPVSTVDQCSCGVLHVSLGALTIRLQPDVVESIWLTLGQAIQQLSAQKSAGLLPHGVLVGPSNHLS